MEPFPTIGHIENRNRERGYHFFDAGTMKSFGSRVVPDVYGGRIFITSEEDRHGGAWGGQRRYTVRMARDEGSIGELSEFGEYETLAQARKAAQRFADADPRTMLEQARQLVRAAAELADPTGEDETGGQRSRLCSIGYRIDDEARKID